MQPITYLVFTLVSILIQFCVMDFINDTIEEKHEISKRNAPMTRIVEKPHGLFYRISNISIDMTTETSSTILDWIYDDNISTTEENFFTEIATSNYENVTEVTLFNKSTVSKPKIPKKMEAKCGCNILFKTCDISCCCDTDCSDTERLLFANCGETCLEPRVIHSCDSCQMKRANFLENLFCISKTNLPDKRLTDIQFDEAAIYRFPRWHSAAKRDESNGWSIYKYNDPIWLANESRFYAEVPMAVASNYCSHKKPIRFLRNEDIECIVKLQDLHMFDALKHIDSRVVSLVEANTTQSETVHANWTLVICDENQCRAYNKTRDEPHCTDIFCDNIATTVQYNFYCNNSRIMRAVLTLHVRKVAMQLPFIVQNVKVNFHLTNDSIEDIIKLSGNPGYNWGLPILVSDVESNHTMHFFNKTSGKRMLTYPDNKNGQCLSSNLTYKSVQFGHNKRTKCVFRPQVNFKNATTACHSVQNQIFHLLGINSTLHVSPYGNPEQLRDDHWLRMQIERTLSYGVLKHEELTCNNIIVGVGYVMVFESRRNKIVYANVEGTAQNITFDTDDASTVITVETSFIELTSSLEFAGAPHLSVNLPKSFFVPNRGNIRQLHLIVLIIALTIK